MIRLGVNIDHIATLRQARLEGFPDPALLAEEAIAGGADGIVCHLREDRRHVQDDDVIRLRKLPTRLDLEMAATSEMLKIALKIKPDMVTLVPEKRQEITTEGGLNAANQLKKLKLYVAKLQRAGIIVSLFVDPESKQIAAAAKVGAKFIEIHTGEYARGGSLVKVKQIVDKAVKLGLRVNAGHGLDYDNVKPIAAIPGVEELNIGFSIIARAVIVGLRQAVKEMKGAMEK
ncbi:pyridoxine 5'-phosphate synthase [Candidatus Saganbacteria bacterium]|nr:pyridoxine 5'-phosphate synthase [Candidatus Saganbacteria bacterium]